MLQNHQPQTPKPQKPTHPPAHPTYPPTTDQADMLKGLGWMLAEDLNYSKMIRSLAPARHN